MISLSPRDNNLNRVVEACSYKYIFPKTVQVHEVESVYFMNWLPALFLAAECSV